MFSAALIEPHPLLRLGLFSNRYMQYAVGVSLVLLLAVVYVPQLQPIFNTTALGWQEWQLMLPLIAVPALAAEGLKWWWQRSPPAEPRR